MQREAIPVEVNEAHQIALRRARKYLSLVLRVPPDRIHHILSTPHGAELVLSAVATVRRKQSEYKEKSQQQRHLIGDAQGGIIATEIIGAESMPLSAIERMVASVEGSLNLAPPAPNQEGVTVGKEGSISHSPFLRRDELGTIKSAFYTFFLDPKNQELYQFNSRLPWQIRMDRIIRLWNAINPTQAILPYQGKQSYRNEYSIHGGEDFQRVFGFHPTQYTLHRNAPKPSEDGVKEENEGTPDLAPHGSSGGEAKTSGMGDPSRAARRDTAEIVPLSSMEKRQRALDSMNQGVRAISTQIQAYVRGKPGIASLSRAVLRGELENFEVNSGGSYHLIITLTVDGEETQKTFSSLFTSLGYIHHMLANGWKRDQKRNTWSPPEGNTEFTIHIPYFLQMPDTTKAESGDKEDLMTTLSTMKGMVITFINSYTESLRTKRFEPQHDVAVSHTIPPYPEGFILTQMKDKNISCRTGNRPLPERLYQVLQEREKLSVFLEKNRNTYPGLEILIEGRSTVFRLERNGYTLDLFTGV